MPLLEMGDSSEPPAKYPSLPVWGFYIGGDTPHIWPDDQVDAIPSRWALPIFTRNTPGANAAADAQEIIEWLDSHRWTPGVCVAVDSETSVLPDYLGALNAHITAAGFHLIDYQSKGAIDGNPETSGGRWVADWTGLPHMYEGAVITQYASATMAKDAWDHDVIDSGVKLHELHPPAVHRIPTGTATATVYEVSHGDTGQAVRNAQSLLEAWEAGTVGPAGIDGIFGDQTLTGLAMFQRIHGITAGRGTVTVATWEALLAH